MRRGPEHPRPRSLLATSASRAPEQLRLAHPRSVVVGKARCRQTLDALSAPWAAALGKLPPELASTIPRSGATTPRPLPQGALRRRRRQTAADMRPLPSASPASTAAASPRPTIRRRHCCHASAKDRRSRPQWSGEHGADAAAGAEWSADTRRRKPPALCGQPAGHFRPARPDLRSPGQDGRLKPTPRARGPWRRSLHGRARASDASCQHESPRFRDA